MKDPLAPHRHYMTRENHRMAKLTRANTIHRGDIERIVWKQTNVPRKYCRVIIRETVKQIVYHVAKGHRFFIPNFGALFHRKHRAGNGKIVDSVHFSTSFGMREDLIDGEYKKSCLDSSEDQREERRKRATKPLSIEKVPTRTRHVKSYQTEIAENKEKAKPDKWGKKKRRKR